MIDSFTAIDFETANGNRSSICQVGLVQVRNGAIIDSLNILVQPPDNYYWSKFTDIHGISSRDTKNSPTFDIVWQKIKPFILNQEVVAHNGKRFDFPVLKQTLEFYGLEEPQYSKNDTYLIFKKRLNLLAQEYNIPLNHHDALSDAKACAHLFIIHNKNE